MVNFMWVPFSKKEKIMLDDIYIKGKNRQNMKTLSGMTLRKKGKSRVTESFSL